MSDLGKLATVSETDIDACVRDVESLIGSLDQSDLRVHHAKTAFDMIMRTLYKQGQDTIDELKEQIKDLESEISDLEDELEGAEERANEKYDNLVSSLRDLLP